jgi:ABC-type nitrate/sulfonate/bicarbonate transport system substrate-binding protein
MRVPRACLTTLTAVILAALLAAMPGQAEAETVRVVTSSTGWLYATAYIAQEMHYFRDAGLDVSIEDGGGGSNAVATLIGGSAQIGNVGLANMAKAVAKGVPLKAVGTGLRGFPQFLLVNKAAAEKAGITPADSLAVRMAILKGSSVGVEDIGGSSAAFVRALLHAGGVPDGAVSIINLLGNTAELASIKANRVGGVAQTPPVSNMAIEAGYAMSLASATNDLPGVSRMEYIVQAVRADYLRDHADVVRRYLTAIHRAEVLAHQDGPTARDAFFRYMARGMPTMRNLPANVRNAAWDDAKSTIPDTLVINPAGVVQTRKFFHIPDAATDAAMVDNTLATEIMATK